MKKNLYLLGLLLAISCPALSFADPVRMNIQPNGSGSFVLTGVNADGVQSLDVEVDYDPGQLSNPAVLPIIGGDLMYTNADSPGKLYISVNRRVAHGVLQIPLYFDAMSDTPGGIKSVSAVVRSRTATSGGNEDESAGAASPARPVGKTLAGEMAFLMREERNVLERFKQFKGEKTLDSFVALFGRSDGDKIVQDPAIAISDGKTPVTIRMEVQPEGLRSAGIALADATLISKETNEKGMVITVLPREGTWNARLVMVAGQEILDYPLVVAPPVNVTGISDANNFLDALQAYITNQSSTLKREEKIYITEYIFTANYLADKLRKARLSVPQH